MDREQNNNLQYRPDTRETIAQRRRQMGWGDTFQQIGEAATSQSRGLLSSIMQSGAGGRNPDPVSPRYGSYQRNKELIEVMQKSEEVVNTPGLDVGALTSRSAFGAMNNLSSFMPKSLTTAVATKMNFFGPGLGNRGRGGSMVDQYRMLQDPFTKMVQFEQQRLMQQQWQQMQQQMQGGAGGGDGQPVNGGTKVDQANPFVAKASLQFGVPTAVLKAVIERESSGDWARDGGRYVHINRAPWFDYILPYVGIFSKAWSSWGCPGTAQQAVGNQQAQVDCLARGLAMWYGRAKAENPAYGWENVAAMHFSGQYDPKSQWSDGTMTVETYVNNFMEGVNRYGGIRGGQPGAGGANGASGAISTIWGNQWVGSLDYGFGSPEAGNYYSYQSRYGLSGGHTGIDIPMEHGAAIYSPVSGRVICACTGSGSECAAFPDTMGSGCGRIEIETADGARIIFGHSSTSNFRVGDTVQAGQSIGTVGGMNGFHVHLEVRIRDGSTDSGWRIIDPNQYFSGTTPAAPMPTMPGMPGMGGMPSMGGSYLDFLKQALKGYGL